MSDNQTGQVNRSAAEIYEEFFLPALFQEWTERVVEAAHIIPGQSVLDVACGTGVLARTAARRVGLNGSVIGLDINQGMLAVAQEKAPEIEWRHGQAEALPFDDNSFDAVVSQFGLMFFQDRSAAIHEMGRVLKRGGHLAVAVWDILENTPGYASMTTLLERLFGAQSAEALNAPYSLGDTQILRSLFNIPDFRDVQIITLEGTARFPSINSWVFTDIKGWTLSDSIDETQYQRLLKEAEKELQPYVIADGRVEFPAPAHLVTAVKS